MTDLPKRVPCRVCGLSHRTITPDQCLDRSISEFALQRRVMGRARKRGWVVVHPQRAVVGRDRDVVLTPMPVGWPDLLLFNPKTPGPRLIAMELKSEIGQPTPEQLKWLQLFIDCGIPAVIVRPSDLREGRVVAILEGR